VAERGWQGCRGGRCAPCRAEPGRGNPMAVRSSQAVDRVDAVAPCIGLDGDGGAGGDPGPGGLTAGLPAHPVPTWLHAGSAHAARRSRSRLRQSGACHLAPGSAAATADERASDMRAFYAQPCILTHSSLDLISDCAPAFSAVSVGNQIAESERLKYGLPAWLVAYRSSSSGHCRLARAKLLRWFCRSLARGSEGEQAELLQLGAIVGARSRRPGRPCAPRRAGSARPCRRGSRWRPAGAGPVDG
jgi:hypothetical protein